MKKLFQSKYLTMLCFLVLLAAMLVTSIRPVKQGLRLAANTFLDTGKLDFSSVERFFNETYKGKYWFITLNGAFQKALGARVVNERYQLDNGHLTYIIGEYDMDGIAGNTVAFRNALEERDIPMVYVNTPFKIQQTDKQLPLGTEDHSNENADRFLACLREENVTVFDLREIIAAEKLDHYDMFYRTDHHWKAESGLWAAGEIVEFLSGWNGDYAVKDGLLEPSAYTYEVHEDRFLGSAGKRVGSIYAGMDDFTVITPNFETEFSFSAMEGEIYREGSFSDVFIVRDILNSENKFTSSVYSTYCGDAYAHIEIRNTQTGPNRSCTDKKILIIRDSFSDVLIPFLSLGYEELDVIDLRMFDQDLMAYVEKSDPDLVLVVYNPGAYENNNLNMFDFLR